MNADDKKSLVAFQVLITMVFEPFVMVALWRWYVMPLGVMPLTWSSAIGINMLANVVIYRWKGERTPDEEIAAGWATITNFTSAFVVGAVIALWTGRLT